MFSGLGGSILGGMPTEPSNCGLSAPEPGDIALMERVRGGDGKAFRELVERHQRPLLNFFARQGVSMHEDLAQETFVRLWKHRNRYRPTAKFTTFLYTVARHVLQDFWRRQKRFEAFRERYARESTAATDGGVARLRTELDIQTALAELSPAVRETVVLAVCQGLPYEEVSAILRIPVGTVKSRVFNALSTLKERFREKPNAES